MEGVPCTIRTCDLLVRSQGKGGNWGQQETAAPAFLGLFVQPEATADNPRLRGIVSHLSVGLSV